MKRQSFYFSDAKDLGEIPTGSPQRGRQIISCPSKITFKQVAQLSQRDHAMHELLRFAKLGSRILKPPFWGLRGNVDVSCVRRWKKRGRLPIGDNWTL